MRRIFALLLALTILLSFATVHSEECTAPISVRNEEVTIHYPEGDVVTGETELDGDLNVEENKYALDVEAYGNSYDDRISASYTVDGNVSLSNEEYHPESGSDYSDAVTAKARGSSDVGIQVTGNINVSVKTDGDSHATGIYAYSDGGGNVAVKAEKNATAIIKTEQDETAGYAVYGYAGENGSNTDITVEQSVVGNVEIGTFAFGKGTLTIGDGITGTANVIGEGRGSTTLTVKDGGITRNGFNSSQGLNTAVLVQNTDSSINVDITGGITSDKSAIKADNHSYRYYYFTPEETEALDIFDKLVPVRHPNTVYTYQDTSTGIDYFCRTDENGNVLAAYKHSEAGFKEASQNTISIKGNILSASEVEESLTAVDITARNDGTEATFTMYGETLAANNKYTSQAVNFEVEENAVLQADINADIIATTAEKEVEIEVVNDDNFIKPTRSNAMTLINGGGTINVSVVGDLSATGAAENHALSIGTSVSKTGLKPSSVDISSLPESDVTINGTFEVDQEEYPVYQYTDPETKETNSYICVDGKWQVLIDVYDEGLTSVVIQGDVISDTYGLDFTIPEAQKADVIVDGTVVAEKSGIVLYSDETVIGENLTLTVWQVVPNKNTVVSRATQDENYEWVYTQDEEAEKKLQYIIRIRENQKDMISISGTTEYEGYTVAKEGETVTLKLEIPEGYEIEATYGDVDQETKLLMNEDGEYYLIVPKGGAVELSLSLKEIPKEDEDEDEDEDAGGDEKGEDKKDEEEHVPENIPVYDTYSRSFSVTLDPNGGVVNGHRDVFRFAITEGAMYSLPTPDTRDGYDFVGWYVGAFGKDDARWTAPPEKDTSIRPASEKIRINKDLVLTAIWKEKE